MPELWGNPCKGYQSLPKMQDPTPMVLTPKALYRRSGITFPVSGYDKNGKTRQKDKRQAFRTNEC